MDIELFEDTYGNILYNTTAIDEEIEKFYITKFSDKGIKQNYVNKHKVRMALGQITLNEFNKALHNISEKSLSWDRLPIGVI